MGADWGGEMKFDNCTSCGNPVMNRKSGGVAIVGVRTHNNAVANLCSDCARAELDLADRRLVKALETAERSGV